MDDSSQPLISLIIPTVGSKTLPECLASAKKALAGFSYEILVTRDCGLGVSETRNRGLLKAKGQYFILIDDDCILDSLKLIKGILSSSQEEDLLHGGIYKLAEPASYWARVYSLTNILWLERGQDRRGHQQHLLGGFLFGSRALKKQIHFSTDLKWGGEEKELLLRLGSLGIYGKLHKDLAICHLDRSGFRKFVKRAFLQGFSAGEHKLQSPSQGSTLQIPWIFLPGLSLFYLFSRMGIFLGKLKIFFGTRIKAAESSPSP